MELSKSTGSHSISMLSTLLNSDQLELIKKIELLETSLRASLIGWPHSIDLDFSEINFNICEDD